jgi:hypothetical protein
MTVRKENEGNADAPNAYSPSNSINKAHHCSKQASNDPAQITGKNNLTALIVGGASRRHFFDHDATFEDILEGWKLMDAERKRVFAIR